MVVVLPERLFKNATTRDGSRWSRLEHDHPHDAEDRDLTEYPHAGPLSAVRTVPTEPLGPRNAVEDIHGHS